MDYNLNVRVIIWYVWALLFSFAAWLVSWVLLFFWWDCWVLDFWSSTLLRILFSSWSLRSFLSSTSHLSSRFRWYSSFRSSLTLFIRYRTHGSIRSPKSNIRSNAVCIIRFCSESWGRSGNLKRRWLWWLAGRKAANFLPIMHVLRSLLI